MYQVNTLIIDKGLAKTETYNPNARTRMWSEDTQLYAWLRLGLSLVIQYQSERQILTFEMFLSCLTFILFLYNMGQ